MIRDFLSRLFPPELVAYIPGEKIIVGAIATAVAAILPGVDVLGDLDVLGVSVPIGALIYAVAAYLWPSNDPVVG